MDSVKNIQSLTEETVSSLMSWVEKEKEKLIKDALSKHTNQSFEYLTQRRFPAIIRIQRFDIDVYYFDNGTIDGVFLIAFQSPNIVSSYDTDGSMSVRLQLKPIYTNPHPHLKYECIIKQNQL